MPDKGGEDADPLLHEHPPAAAGKPLPVECGFIDRVDNVGDVVQVELAVIADELEQVAVVSKVGAEGSHGTPGQYRLGKAREVAQVSAGGVRIPPDPERSRGRPEWRPVEPSAAEAGPHRAAPNCARPGLRLINLLGRWVGASYTS